MQFSNTQNAIRLVNLEDKLKKLEKELKEIRSENNKLRRDTRDMYNVLYTVICKQVGDKPTASSWVKGSFDNQWNDLIHQAQAWKYGVELDLRNEVLQFLDFVIVQVSQTQLFNLHPCLVLNEKIFFQSYSFLKLAMQLLQK